jgi:integrase
LEPLIGIIAAVPLRELTAATVRSALKELAATRATGTVAMAHAGLTRAIRHAEANDKVRRNVATLVDTPAAQGGRPSKSLTFGPAVALIGAARSYGLYAYVVLGLLVGVRTEEARTLRWDHVDLDGNPAADPPMPPMSTSGVPYVSTAPRRRRSPGARWGCPRWR